MSTTAFAPVRKPVTAALLFALITTPVHANLNLADVPLTVNNRVAPNVFFELDDSGSMDFEILMTPYWHYCAYDPDAAHREGDYDCGGDDRITTGRWEAHRERWWGIVNYEYIYLFENNDNRYGNTCQAGDRNGNAAACGDDFVARDWRTRSPALNVTWFNPTFDYQPWPGFDDADFDSARSNPPESGNTRDLDGFVWYDWVDDKGYAGERPRRGDNANMTTEPNGEVDLWDTRVRHEIDGTQIRRTRIAVDELNDGEIEYARTSLASITGAEADTVKQNVANWYQYHRRRMFVAKNAIADVIETSPGYRYGLSVLNRDGNLFVEVPEQSTGDFSEHDAALREALYEFEQPSAGTPLRRALRKVGQYYAGERSGTRDPIVEACQKNFAILFSDGYWNGGSPGVGDVDGDGYRNTLADVAREYYERDLSDLPNEVPPDAFDTAEHQHMNTFTVAFGVEGLLRDTDGDGWPNPPLDTGDDWGDPTIGANAGEDPRRIDDLWHAAWNGRGTFVSARTPEQVIQGLRDALGNIAARSSTSTSATTNSTSLDADTKAYQARFDSGTWVGELLAYELNEDGTVGENVWEAGQFLSAGGRNILSVATDPDSDTTDQGIDFTDWSALSDAQQAALNRNADGQVDGRGPERLAYLAGDQSNEGQGNDDFRVRTSLLGDIVNSNPLFVGPDDYGYSTLDGNEGDSYFAFRNANENRRSMLYVGANDGMLHGFDADSGQEVLAYVPGGVFGNLSQLTDPDYTHQYYVNASPFAGDAYLDGSWSTVLVGATGQGGNSVFALDVTDPDGFTPDNVLWEFTHPELGRTIGQPKLGRMENGDWVAVFGNGYNSQSHEAKLFIVNLEDPDDYRIIETDDAGNADDPNGMAAPFIADLNGNGSIDAIYAGDLHGRMWKFDVSDSGNNPDWDVAYGQNNNPDPLFTATSGGNERQPITTEPEVTLDNRGDPYVLFGTGKYLEEQDTTAGDDPRMETFYGVKDTMDGEVARGDLTEQTILDEQRVNGTDYRLISNTAVASNDQGWRLDLAYEGDQRGERVIFNPQLRRGRLIVNTVIPTDNPCSVGGQSWRMDLDPFSGSRLEYTVYDVDGDGELTVSDFLDSGDGGEAPASGRGSGNFQTPPTFTSDGDGGDVSVTSSAEGPPSAQSETGGREPIGRQSWRELFFGG